MFFYPSENLLWWWLLIKNKKEWVSTIVKATMIWLPSATLLRLLLANATRTLTSSRCSYWLPLTGVFLQLDMYDSYAKTSSYELNTWDVVWRFTHYNVDAHNTARMHTHPLWTHVRNLPGVHRHEYN
jgi:hypothetical protein